MMTNIAPHKTFRFFLAFTMVLGMLISAVGTTTSHLPVNLKVSDQVGLAEVAQEIDDHGHSHEDGEFDEQLVSHTHDHNPADHSHETPHLLTHLYSVSPDMARTHFVGVPVSNELGVFFRLDRPPKLVSLV